jgi:hypothetical protein
LFSTTKVGHRLDPGVTAVREIERHHLFPKQHLEQLGIRGAARTNQVANMAFVDWSDNAAISAKPPETYWPTMSRRVDAARLKQQCYWHALPAGWEQLPYEDFLEKRRKLIAQVVRDGFQRLLPAGQTAVGAGGLSISELIRDGESASVEFKSTARWNLKGNVKDARLEHVIVKTVAGFMNNEGGTLLIGVDDAGTPVGLESDYRTLQKPGRDGFELFLGDLFKANLSGPAHMLTHVKFDVLGDHDVCRIDVAASARPVFTRSADGKEPTEFWVRAGNSTRQLVGDDMVAYKEDRWG